MTPPLSEDDSVVELHFGKNVSNVTRTLNTENVVTKLYAYGSFGDKVSGYCGIDECEHDEYSFVLSSDVPENTEVYFTIPGDAGETMAYTFSSKTPINSGTKMIFSKLDPSSMLYVWNDSDEVAYPVSRVSYDPDRIAP